MFNLFMILILAYIIIGLIKNILYIYSFIITKLDEKEDKTKKKLFKE